MDLDDLRRIGGAAKQSAFRLETLPQYLVPQEADEFADWKAGKPMPVRTTKRSREMALRRLSGDCNDETSPGLWDEDQMLDDVIAVGTLLDRRRCRSAKAKSRSGFPDV